MGTAAAAEANIRSAQDPRTPGCQRRRGPSPRRTHSAAAVAVVPLLHRPFTHTHTFVYACIFALVSVRARVSYCRAGSPSPSAAGVCACASAFLRVRVYACVFASVCVDRYTKLARAEIRNAKSRVSPTPPPPPPPTTTTRTKHDNIIHTVLNTSTQ